MTWYLEVAMRGVWMYRGEFHEDVDLCMSIVCFWYMIMMTVKLLGLEFQLRELLKIKICAEKFSCSGAVASVSVLLSWSWSLRLSFWVRFKISDMSTLSCVIDLMFRNWLRCSLVPLAGWWGEEKRFRASYGVSNKISYRFVIDETCLLTVHDVGPGAPEKSDKKVGDSESGLQRGEVCCRASCSLWNWSTSALFCWVIEESDLGVWRVISLLMEVRIALSVDKLLFNRDKTDEVVV